MNSTTATLLAPYANRSDVSPLFLAAVRAIATYAVDSAEGIYSELRAEVRANRKPSARLSAEAACALVPSRRAALDASGAWLASLPLASREAARLMLAMVRASWTMDAIRIDFDCPSERGVSCATGLRAGMLARYRALETIVSEMATRLAGAVKGLPEREAGLAFGGIDSTADEIGRDHKLFAAALAA